MPTRTYQIRSTRSRARARCRGFYSGDIARLVVKELSGEGVKVWR